MKANMHALSIVFCLVLLVNYTSADVVPFGGNAWPTIGGSIDANGYTFTTVPAETILYTYVSTAGDAVISLNLKSVNDSVSIQVQVGSQSQTVTQAASATPVVVSIGTLGLLVGYNQIKVSITGANAATTGVLTSLNTGAFVLANFVQDLPNFEGGRTGSGVRVDFDLVNNGLYKVRSAYSAVYVVKAPVPGTNYNAIGFDVGYLGLSVAVDQTKSIVFSATSPFVGANLNDLPPSVAPIATKIGFNVVQSVVGVNNVFTLNYDWALDVNYQFFLKATNDFGAYRVIYEAWFFDPATFKWLFLVELNQAQPNVVPSGYYAGIHPFSSATGNEERQFVINKFYVSQLDQFHEVLSGTYNIELNTQSSSDRRDTFGGFTQEGELFFLATGGFFNVTVAGGATLTRSISGGPFHFNRHDFKAPTKPYTVALGPISYSTQAGSTVSGSGFSYSSYPASTTSYVDITNGGQADVYVTLLGHEHLININVIIAGQSRTVPVIGTQGPNDRRSIFIGTFTFVKGYNKIEINVLSDDQTSGSGTLTALNIDGKKADFELFNVVVDPTSNEFVRAGASPILYYKVKTLENITYTYSEVGIPAGSDIGTTHTAAISMLIAGITLDTYNNGTRRSISLFMNMKDDDLANVIFNRRNPDAYTLNVGIWHLNIAYNWTTDVTYKCLLKVVPDLATNTTNVTAWFKVPENTTWTLIGEVSFLKTYTFNDRPVSEIHVLPGEVGNVQKRAFIGNVHAFDSNGRSEELNSAQFYEDIVVLPPDSARTRRDMRGGLNNAGNKILLATGGYKNKYTPLGTMITRKRSTSPPQIDFANLP